MSFRAEPGEKGAVGEGPKDRIPPRLFSYGLALAQGHAAWPWDAEWDPAWWVAAAHPVFRSHGAPSSLPHRTALLQARPRLLLPVQSLVCLAAFGLALPLAISLFPQMSEVSVGKVSRAGWVGTVLPFINKYLFSADSLALS